MRTALLILATMLLISGSFAAYMHLQPAREVRPEAAMPVMHAATTQSSSAESMGGIREGTGGWILNFDAKTGRLASRFRTDHYYPKPTGVIYCTNPIAEFFLSNNERMRIVGKEGEVVMKDTPDVTKGFAKSGPSGPPDRGRMKDVTVYLYDNQIDDEEHESRAHTIVTMTTDNIDFDNDSFLITTQSFIDASGKTVAADQVPVHVRGDYDFDGRGLTLRWNDRDGRLELLEIAHGERLIIYPNKSNRLTPMEGTIEPATAPAVAPVASDEPLEGSELASAARGSTGAALPATTRRGAATRRSNAARHPTTEPDHPPYQANFYDNVHMKQGPGTYADAETLRIHFKLKSQPAGAGAEQTGAAAAPGDSPAGKSSGPAAAAPEPGARIADGGINASPSLATKPTTGPTTGPSTRSGRATTRPAALQEKVEITWTGRLVVAPTQAPPPRELEPGKAILELLGKAKQVFVHRAASAGQDASEVHCASLLYQNSDGSALLNSSAKFPQVLLSRVPTPEVAATRPADAPPTQVVCETLDYQASKHIALLLGHGHAIVPVTDNSNSSPTTAPATQPGVPRVLDAKWDQQAKLYLLPKSSEEMSIERATFDGNVDIVHPQLALKSQSLDLTFDPSLPTTRPTTLPAADALPDGSSQSTSATRPAKPSSGPVLKRALASEDVHCKLTNAAGKAQNIDCDRLELDASRDPSGKTYPHQVYTRGNVHAYDETQDLHAGRMDLTLRPAMPKPTTLPSSPDSAAQSSQVASTHKHSPASSDDSASVELEEMVARENVVVTNHEGSVATSDELWVDMVGEDPHVTMSGNKPCKVSDVKHNVLTGPTILVDPHKGLAHVVGAGTLHTIRDTPPGAKPSPPTDVKWADHADVNGNDNRIDVFGKVLTTTIDTDGTVNNASGEHVRIDLENAPAPTTKPSTKPTAVASADASSDASKESGSAHHKAPSTQPAPLQMDLFKGKQPRAITLDDHAMVRSSLTAPNGDIMREFEMNAPLIYYAISATRELPAHSLLVPSAGQMLTRDNRDPAAVNGGTTKPATKPTTKPAKGAGNGEGTEIASSRGATAFQWNKQLLYTEDTHEAVMTGDVLIVHQDADEKQFPVRLTSDKVIAYFEPAKEKAPATRPAGDTRPAADPQQSLQLKSVRATGHLFVTRGPAELAGERLDYDPSTHWMKVYGSSSTPAVFNDLGQRPITANEIWWNTVTWHTKSTDFGSHSTR